MKSKIIILGVIVAALGIFSVSTTRAQSMDLPVSIIPAQKNMIKVIYNNPSDRQVEVKFSDENGVIKKDRISGDAFAQGFAKKYKVQRNSDDTFWVEITNQDMSATYKVTSTRKGLWSAELEQTTFHPVVATR